VALPIPFRGGWTADSQLPPLPRRSAALAARCPMQACAHGQLLGGSCEGHLWGACTAVPLGMESKIASHTAGACSTPATRWA
jgi:hypothetical protein